ncbi:spindle pole body component Spc97p [[Candida] anglica]|uniref:Spindle pole body component n=1 Tax=[Candida] anglica TaxID=148631 RepID=A0ABP0EQY2_9ASCO
MASFISSHPGDNEVDLVVLTEPKVIQSCINKIPKGYSKIRPQALSELNDLRVQQGLIMQDLLFVLLGYEGFYIRYSERYNPNSLDSLIKGPDYKTAKHLDVSLKSITKKLVHFGKYYSALNSFVEHYCSQSSGKVVQRLCTEISQFIVQYQQLIIQIEEEFKHNSSFNLNILENILNQEISVKIHLLYEIITSIHDDSQTRFKLYGANNNINNDREAYFKNFIRNIQNDLRETGNIDLTTDQQNFNQCKGGLVLQIIQQLTHTYHGDQVSMTFLSKLFDAVSIDYVQMLNNWLINGDIDDPYDEFLIKENKLSTANRFQDIIHTRTEKYWDELYGTRTDGLIEQFSSKEIQLKILATGKYLNIFKLCTDINNFEQLGEDLIPIEKLTSRNTELKILEFYDRANWLLMKLYYDGYGFCSIIDSFQKTLLLNESYHMDNFLSNSFNDLRRNKHSVSPSRLAQSYAEAYKVNPGQNFAIIDVVSDGVTENITSNIVDVLKFNQKLTVDSTNFYDLAKEILDVKSFDAEEALKNESSSSMFKALLNKSLERNKISSAGSNTPSRSTYDPDHSDEYTVAGLNLEVHVPFPLNLLITQNFVFEYQLIFKLLVISKFITKLSDDSWKEINFSSVWGYKGFHPRVHKWILRCRILHNRMNDFMKELNFYFNFDIIDTNYQDLKCSIKEIQNFLKQDRQSQTPTNATSPQQSDLFGFRNQFDNYSQNNNSIFDKNILNHSQANNSSRTKSLCDVDNLHKKLSSFLNSILRDTLVTNKDLIESLKVMFDVIISFNHYLSRLKKSLIMINPELFDKFSQDYPSKFQNKNMDDEQIAARFDILNENLNSLYEIFNDGLTDFMNTLKLYGETENQSLLILIERLENCFPDT